MFCQGKGRRILCLFLVFILLTPLSLNAEEPAKEATTITADKAEYVSKDRMSIFIGKVKATRGELTINSDRLEVFFDQKEEKIIKSVAYGNVEIIHEDAVATGQKATFSEEEEKIVLTGSPALRRGDDEFLGEKITLFLKKDLIIFEGKVKGAIMPERAKKP